jgi:hypothetical protein
LSTLVVLTGSGGKGLRKKPRTLLILKKYPMS